MAYEVKLDVFQGPLDLLLHLIEKEEIDISNIPIALITQRYLEYLHTIRMLNLDGVGDFLVMAATLMQIKVRMLLPAPSAVSDPEGGPEEDPCLELARKLIEYKKIKEAAVLLQRMEQRQFMVYTRIAGEFPDRMKASPDQNLKTISVCELFEAFQVIINSMKIKQHQSAIPKPEISIKQRMTELMDRVKAAKQLSFREVFGAVTTKVGLITCFLAVLELLRLRKLSACQTGVFADIILVLPEKVCHKVESDAS
jgi:segregation and condensation protein A